MSSTTTTQTDSSWGSLASPRKSKAASDISRRYKQARDLFLQRRLPEALSIISPLVTESQQGRGAETQAEQDKTPAPVAGASHGSRVKVWSFYITLLNAIAELGPGEGRNTFGSHEWDSIIKKGQDGSIWTEVVDIGYGGLEGQVDPDVVVNLVNLLLAQSPTQTTNQQQLESWLSTSAQPRLDQFATQINLKEHAYSNPSHHSGTNTPRDLETKVTIIELFTLHVLPRNGEWEYAKEFINMSEILDEERRDSFLQTLTSLEDEEKGTTPLHQIEPRHEPEKVQDTPIADSISSDSASTVKESRPSSRGPDFGIDAQQPSINSDTSKTKSNTTSAPPKPIRKPSSSMYPSRPSRPPGNSAQRRPANMSLYKRSAAILATLQHVISNMGQHLSRNPMAMLRFVLFLVGLVAAFSRQDVKDRLAAAWDKIKRTVGMGVKVSYI